MSAYAFYYTKPRDTMSDIARIFHTTSEEIRRLNPGAPLISISYNPGMEIRVPCVNNRRAALRNISAQEPGQRDY